MSKSSDRFTRRYVHFPCQFDGVYLGLSTVKMNEIFWRQCFDIQDDCDDLLFTSVKTWDFYSIINCVFETKIRINIEQSCFFPTAFR